jgi:ankyrin repeat domain-containing protein 50
MKSFSKLKIVLFVSLFSIIFLSTSQAANNINEKLWQAANSGNIDELKKFLAKGADPNYCRNGYTVLMCAAHQGHLSVTKILVAKGAKVNLADDGGVTALIEASAEGHDEIVDFLTKQGADVNVRNKNGDTALSFAMMNKSLCNRDNVDCTNTYSKIINILRLYGAKG